MTGGRPWYHQLKQRSIFPEAAPLLHLNMTEHCSCQGLQQPATCTLAMGTPGLLGWFLSSVQSGTCIEQPKCTELALTESGVCTSKVWASILMASCCVKGLCGRSLVRMYLKSQKSLRWWFICCIDDIDPVYSVAVNYMLLINL